MLARLGMAHGDLSAYNLLVHRGQLIMIDTPQVVDVIANPRGAEFLDRDAGQRRQVVRRAWPDRHSGGHAGRQRDLAAVLRAEARLGPGRPSSSACRTVATCR